MNAYTLRERTIDQANHCETVADGVLDAFQRVERAADELARIREDAQAEMLRMIATMNANHVAYFMKEAGRG